MSINIIIGSSAFAFADNTTADYYYYNANGSGSSGQVWRGTNSADVLGYILAVFTRNQQELYTLMSNMSSGGSDLSTVNLNTTNIVKLLDGTSSGIYTLISQSTNTKLDLIAEGIGTGSSLDNLQTKLSGVGAALSRIEQKLHYWDNSHGRSYDAGEMIFNIMNSSNDIVENTSSVPAIKQDTSYIPSINTNTSNILSRIDTFTKTTFRYLSKNGTYDAELTFNDMGNNNVPYYSYNNGSPRVLYTGAANIGLQGYLDVINKNLVSVGNLIHENYAYYTVYSKDANGNYNAISRYNYSLMDVLQNINVQFGSMLAPIQYMIADANALAAKRANASQEQAALTNFTGSGSASASASDFADIASGFDSVKSGIDTNVSATNAFSVFTNSDGYSWFSNDTMNNLNSTGSRSRKAGSADGELTYYNNALNAIYEAMGVKYD